MTALVSLLFFCQALGALVGVVATVWGELAYLRALRDGKVDAGERAHLRSIAHGLRYGMTLLLVSSTALVIVAYVLRAATQPALTGSYWMLIIIALLVISVSWALSRKKISFALGSAGVFTAWWFLVFLTLGGSVSTLSFGAAAAFFIVATGIWYGVLQYVRMLAHPRQV